MVPGGIRGPALGVGGSNGASTARLCWSEALKIVSGLAQLRQLPLGVSNLGASGGDEALRLLSGSLDDASRLGSRLLQELPCIRTGTHENLGEIVFLPTVLREGVLQRCAATVALLPRGTRLQSKEKHQRIGILYQVAESLCRPVCAKDWSSAEALRCGRQWSTRARHMPKRLLP